MDEEASIVESSPRKRDSPLKKSSDGGGEVHNDPRRKKRKSSSGKNRNKQKLQSRETAIDDNKENNGRRLTGSKHSKVTDDEGMSANSYFEDRNINRVNKPPEAGVISKIYVENFMCHQKLTVELCRNVNFIYGQNGSGKSAILAAIQICLGAGARRTNRARNLKELVRKGTTSNCAKIRVTLLNQGDDSFKHDIYGDTITVERTIALRGGYNGYKLYSADNIERSRSKKDLDEMLDKLNIQVENPVAILDQEEAKKFLTGKAGDKYKFFMKATELERIDNTYASTTEQICEMQQQAERLVQSLDTDHDLVVETKKAFKQHQEIGKLEAKKSKFEICASWSAYSAALLDLQTKMQKLEKFEAKAKKKKQELTQAEIASQEADNPNDDRRNRLEELSMEAEEMTIRKRELEQDLKRSEEPKRALIRQLKALQKDEEKANRGLLEANQRLQSKRDEIVAKAGSAESEQAQRNERLKGAEERYTERKIRHTELKQTTTEMLHSYEKVEPEVQGARQNISQLEHHMKGITSRIKSMESSSGNSLDVFGAKCNKVKQLVDKAQQKNQFRGPVLGPLGFFCKVQSGKEEFASLAETAMGGGLDRFVVFNDADRKLYQKIRLEAGCQSSGCNVFQQYQHPRYNTPEAPQGVETIASVLTIENDLVFNCLVDNARIEQKALTRSKSESENLLLIKDNHNRNAIRGGKIKEVYFFPNGDNWKVMKGGKLQLVSNSRKLKQSIGVDRTAAIEEDKEEYRVMNEEIKVMNRDYNRLEHEHTDYKKRWNASKKEMYKTQKDIDQVKKDIEDIKAEESATAEMEVDTTLEEQDVAEAQDYLDELKNRKIEGQESMKIMSPQIETKKADVAEIAARNEKVLEDMRNAENELTQHYHLLSQQKEKMEKARARLQQYEELVQSHSAVIEGARDEANHYLRTARLIQFHRKDVERRRKLREAHDGPTVDSQASSYSQDPTEEELENVQVPDNLGELKQTDYYLSKVQQATIKIDREKGRRLENADDEDAAYEKYVRAKEIFQAKKDQIKEIESSSKQMEDDMSIRRRRWSDFRNYISHFSGIKFDETLNIKGSSGVVKFDHDNEELDLVVQKDSFDESSQQKDVKALSGGEKSFTTIALLLALGETLETPFRVMDEFDVFLDPVTRKLIIDTLIEVGQAMSHRQFVFITPQDVSNVNSSPMLKILQMKPPERRQVAGAPTQQTLDFSQS
mmetsp:Transcript_29485/g.33811  ORF Transcript_29485/g.33811 Transcript_29485/m.33811 type:complete len:1212 (-) Transcript_29485:207-3842(-)